MANLIREQRIIDTNKRTLAKYVIVSDGNQEANTVLLDVSTLAFALNTNGYIMASNVDPRSTYRATIKRIFGQVGSADGAIRLKWHGAANSEIVAFADGGFDFDFQSMGDGATISNPETNTNGDVLISTAGLASGDVATIFIDIKKDARDYDQGQTADPIAFNRGRAAP